MRLDKRAREIQSQPRALRLLDGFRRAIESIEDVRQIFCFDALPFIGYTNDDLFGSHSPADFDFTHC